MQRDDLTFPSGSGACAAWFYPAADADGPRPCVVMSHGFSLTRHDGLPAYAERFAAAGCAVLVFDHRHLGDSRTDTPQRFRHSEQLEDVRSAIAYARSRPDVDADRIVLWGFSMSGNHAVRVAASDPRLAAVVLVCPFLDGLSRALGTPPKVTAWILPKAIGDMASGRARVPVTGQPGDLAAMTLPGEADGFARVVPPGSPWRNEISPGLFTTVMTNRPFRLAPRIACPVWVGVGGRDVSVSAKAVRTLAERAPRGELHEYPDYDHFDPFAGEGAERVAADQVAFLARLGLATAPVAA